MANSTPDHELGVALTCFVIGPIGSRLAPLGTEERTKYENGIQTWENVFEPACQRFGMQPLRADKLAQPGEITEQVFALLRDADVVIADLTGGNANVMYELGLRHTRDLVTIQIGEYERLPFDVNIIRTIQFRRTEAGLMDARESLIEALRAALQGKATPVTATRLWKDPQPMSPDALAAVAVSSQQPDDDPDAESSEPGFIDILAEGEVAVVRMGEIMVRFGQLMEEVAAISRDATDEISASDSRGGGFGARLQIARNLAASLDPPGKEMDTLSDEYVSMVNTVGAAVGYIIGTVESDPGKLGDVRDYFALIVTMANSAEDSSVSLTGYAHSTRNLSKITRDLIPVAKLLSRSTNRIISGNEEIVGWRDRIRALPGWADDGDESD